VLGPSGGKAGPTQASSGACSQDPPLSRPHLRVGSGGEGFLLEILVCVRPFEGKWLLLFFLCLELLCLSKTLYVAPLDLVVLLFLLFFLLL